MRKYNEHYASYMSICADLAATLKIVSYDAIESINKNLKTDISQDKSTWKYFLNACGEYHHTDIPMMVFSADTNEEIIFSAETLKTHTSTRQLFLYGTTEYYSLLHQYKEQEALILGSLYPAEMRNAIEAKDGEIIAYPEELIEPQEKTLLSHIQQWIYNFIFRWHVKRYNISSPLYSISRHAVMYSRIPYIISAYRFKLIKTVETHSFHIREHLKSNYRVDSFFEYLTSEQKWWLYRNIEYIIRRAGHQETLYLLIENILTKRGIPISQYHLRQIAEKDGTGIDIKTKRSLAVWRPKDMQILEIDRLMPELDGVVPFSEYKPNADAIKRKIKYSYSGKVSTKFLESFYIDNSHDLKIIKSEMIISQWLFYVSVGLMEGSVILDSDKAIDNNVLSVREALDAVINSEFTKLSLEVKKTGIMEISGFFSGRDFVLTKIKALKVRMLKSTISMINLLPEVGLYHSGKGFNVHAEEVFRKTYCFLTRLERSDETVYNQGIIINAMFPSIGIKINVTEKKYSLKYARHVMESATGMRSIELMSLKEIQNKLVGLVKHLSSYSIRFLDPKDRYFYKGNFFNTSTINSLSISLSGTKVLLDPATSLSLSAKISNENALEYKDLRLRSVAGSINSEFSLDGVPVDITEESISIVSSMSISSDNIDVIGVSSNFEGEENPYIPDVSEFVRENMDLGLQSFKKIT